MVGFGENGGLFGTHPCKFRANENLYVPVIIIQIMASIKLSLDTRRPTITGEYPLIISVSHRSHKLNIATGVYTLEKSFDPIRCVVLGNRALNEQVQKILSYYQSRMQDFLLKRAGEFTVKELREFLMQKEQQQTTTLRPEY